MQCLDVLSKVSKLEKLLRTSLAMPRRSMGGYFMLKPFMSKREKFEGAVFECTHIRLKIPQYMRSKGSLLAQ